MKRIYLFNILFEILLGEIVLILSSIFFDISIVFPILFALIKLLLILLNRRSLWLYLFTVFSDSRFKIVAYDQEKDNTITINKEDLSPEMIELWETLKKRMYFPPISHDRFLKNFQWMIKHYNRKIQANKSDVQRIIHYILKYMKLDSNLITVEVTKDIYCDYAGMFTTIKAIAGKICINTFDGITFFQLFATCFHECMHYWFFRNKDWTGFETEYLVDAALVYFGLDDIAVRGYQEFVERSKKLINNNRDIKIGYLSENELQQLLFLKQKDLSQTQTSIQN